jgi:hypothetical protein
MPKSAKSKTTTVSLSEDEIEFIENGPYTVTKILKWAINILRNIDVTIRAINILRNSEEKIQ